jgi:hypothetical protein
MVGTTSGYEAAVDQFVTKMRRRKNLCLLADGKEFAGD